MTHIKLFDEVCMKISELVTKKYSTSFRLGILLLPKKYRRGVYGIYGFVRFADEIVDTFFHKDVNFFFLHFVKETEQVLEQKVSFNPILHSFQLVVDEYCIEKEHINAFFKSMEMDIHKKTYTDEEYKKYIYGSAEVIGLMCLKVFCERDTQKYDSLSYTAQKLGSAFQKINFLRDIKSDFYERGRKYFPNIEVEKLAAHQKKEIENDIKQDFEIAYKGIQNLPQQVRYSVLLAYKYYTLLLYKIEKSTPSHILHKRIRISNAKKIFLFLKIYIYSLLHI